MNPEFRQTILKATGADDLREADFIQELWSGYGSIIRYALTGAEMDTVIVKHVSLPPGNRRQRGQSNDLSHKRKMRSYQVETAFYEQYASACPPACRIPHCLAVLHHKEEVLIVLEDLDSAGFPERKRSVDWSDIQKCLRWLAHFHATWMGTEPEQLWSVGTYWHLDTRPEELAALDDRELKAKAGKIDRQLRASPYQTLVHGDAKLANFCFPAEDGPVAAVDFQYVGQGCGMKDVAYLTGSCFRDEECEFWQEQVLDTYFTELKAALALYGCRLDPAEIEENWRSLYPVAWADFHRFLKGWSPGYWRKDSYSERISRKVLADIR